MGQSPNLDSYEGYIWQQRPKLYNGGSNEYLKILPGPFPIQPHDPMMTSGVVPLGMNK